MSDFTRIIKSLYEKITAPEITYIFKHFDKGNKGYVSKNDFLTTFSSEIREQSSSFQLSIEDIIKPLATRCHKYNVNIDKLFSGLDKNHNGRISAEELAKGLY